MRRQPPKGHGLRVRREIRLPLRDAIAACSCYFSTSYSRSHVPLVFTRPVVSAKLYALEGLAAPGTLVIAGKKSWKSLPLIALITTQIYFWGWYSEFFHRTSPLERTVVFATLFYLLYSLLPIAKAMRESHLGESDLSIILLNTLALSGALFVLLWPEDKWPLTLFFLALAAAHVAVARLLPESGARESIIARLLFAGLALTFLTLAIPVREAAKPRKVEIISQDAKQLSPA